MNSCEKNLGQCIVTIANELHLTIQQFAASLEVSYSTLSRIINGESSGSESLINDIISKKSPSGTISDDDLWKAFSEAKNKKTSFRVVSVNRLSNSELETKAIKIINSELVKRGFTVCIDKAKIGFFLPDLQIKTNALAPKSSDLKNWAFDFKLSLNLNSHDSFTKQILKSFLQIVGSLRIIDASKPDKFSIVISDKKVFDSLIELLETKVKTDDYISLILLDIENETYIREVILSQRHPSMEVFYPFESPLLQNGSNLYNEWPNLDL